jgi:hypothetical protein
VNVSTSPASPLTWDAFQAILHLSIALNAAYAVVFSFIEDTIQREAKVAAARLDGLRSEPNTLLQQRTIRKIIFRINRIEREAGQFHTAILRPVAGVCVPIGIGELIYSSFYPHEPISDLTAALTCLLLVPVGLAIITYNLLFIYLYLAPRFDHLFGRG